MTPIRSPNLSPIKPPTTMKKPDSSLMTRMMNASRILPDDLYEKLNNSESEHDRRLLTFFKSPVKVIEKPRN